MAKSINMSNVKARLKENKGTMKTSKATITQGLAAMMKLDQSVDVKELRTELSNFTKAFKAVSKDSALVQSAKEAEAK